MYTSLSCDSFLLLNVQQFNIKFFEYSESCKNEKTCYGSHERPIHEETVDDIGKDTNIHTLHVYSHCILLSSLVKKLLEVSSSWERDFHIYLRVPSFFPWGRVTGWMIQCKSESTHTREREWWSKNFSGLFYTANPEITSRTTSGERESILRITNTLYITPELKPAFFVYYANIEIHLSLSLWQS